MTTKTDDQRCKLFGHPERPAVCASLMPSPEMCGDTQEQAMRWLGVLERQTQPVAQASGVLPHFVGQDTSR